MTHLISLMLEKYFETHELSIKMPLKNKTKKK